MAANTVPGTFTPLLDDLVQALGLLPAAVFGRIWRYAQGENGVCHAAVGTIAAELSLGHRTVERYMKALCDQGFLEDLTPSLRNRPHRYRVIMPQEALEDAPDVASEVATTYRGTPERRTEVRQSDVRATPERRTEVRQSDVPATSERRTRYVRATYEETNKRHPNKEAEERDAAATASSPVIGTDSLFAYVTKQMLEGLAWKLVPIEERKVGAMVDAFPSQTVWDRALYECACAHAHNLKYLDKCLATASANVLAETAGMKDKGGPVPDLRAVWEAHQAKAKDAGGADEWDKVLALLGHKMQRQVVDTWLRPCAVSTANHTLEIEPQSIHAREWIEHRLASAVTEGVHGALGDAWDWRLAPLPP